MEKLTENTKGKMLFEEIKRKPGKLENLRSGEMNFIKMLLEKGTVTKTISNDDAENLPISYEIDGIPIKYCTGWVGFMTPFLKNNMFYVKNRDEFKVKLDAIKYLTKQENKKDNEGIYNSFSD